jgi:UPF0042 nucleotide-binding protein
MTARMNVQVLSFSYRRGIPKKADMVFDVRLLPNPHYVDALRPLSGRERPVARFIMGRKETRTYLSVLRPLLKLTLRTYPPRKVSNLRIAFGCTGGRHRSVTIAEAVVRDLNRWGYAAKVIHRDVKREE